MTNMMFLLAFNTFHISRITGSTLEMTKYGHKGQIGDKTLSSRPCVAHAVQPHALFPLPNFVTNNAAFSDQLLQFQWTTYCFTRVCVNGDGWRER